jgi:hypothetical protein
MARRRSAPFVRGERKTTGTSQLTNLPILNTTLTITHFNQTQSSIINTGQHPIQWKACFTGDYNKATITITGRDKKPVGQPTIRTQKKKPTSRDRLSPG